MNNVTLESLEEILNEAKTKLLTVSKAPVDIVSLKKINDKSFVEDASQSPIYSFLINKGFFQNFEEEFPVFMVVYGADKSMFRKALRLPLYISISLDRLNLMLDKNNLSLKDIKPYLMYNFLHEMTHIFEDEFREEFPKEYKNSLTKLSQSKSIRDEQCEKEMFANNIADKFGNSKESKKIEKILFEDLYEVMKGGAKKCLI